jgi:hypothetical protein
MVKNYKVIIDGKKLKDGEFATEIAGMMGALASGKYIFCWQFDNHVGTKRPNDRSATG